MNTQQTPETRSAIVDVSAFRRTIDGMKIVQLAAVYDALVAMSGAVTSITQQGRCAGETRHQYNEAGEMLDEFDDQIGECIAAVIDHLNNLDAKCSLDEYERVRVLLSDQIQRGEDAEHVAAFAGMLAVECGYNKEWISENRDAAE